MSKRNSVHSPDSPVVLHGIAASEGISRGAATLLVRPEFDFTSRTVEDPAHETKRFAAAVTSAIGELETLKLRLNDELGEESAHILRSQQTVLEDDSIQSEVASALEKERCAAEAAVETVFAGYRRLFEELDESDYNRERISDLDDVQKRLIRNLLGLPEVSLQDLDEPTVVVAEELFPSDTVAMNRQYVRGMVTERGGRTSHVAILARTLGIPAAVGVAEATSQIRTGDEVWVDATNAERATVSVRPDGTERHRLQAAAEQAEKRRQALAAERNLPPVTVDGYAVTLSANIGSLEEIERAGADGATSVGLFRSEFLFLHSRGVPDEEAQYQVYRKSVEAFPGGFVLLRTLDVGADKPVPSIPMQAEENPFLGVRGVRVSLERRTLLEAQLRAALRASAHGTLKLMFPMISGPNEVVALRAAVNDVKLSLDREGIPYDDEMEIGIMLEVPSALLMVGELAETVDFFSIGTNDLTQYLLAADRMNERVQAYYQIFHPAVFRAVALVVEAAHARNRWVGICGELGGMTPAIPVLLGLGVDELSMSSGSLAEAIHTIRRTEFSSARELARQVLASPTEADVRDILDEYTARKE